MIVEPAYQPKNILIGLCVFLFCLILCSPFGIQHVSAQAVGFGGTIYGCAVNGNGNPSCVAFGTCNSRTGCSSQCDFGASQCSTGGCGPGPTQCCGGDCPTSVCTGNTTLVTCPLNTDLCNNNNQGGTGLGTCTTPNAGIPGCDTLNCGGQGNTTCTNNLICEAGGPQGAGWYIEHSCSPNDDRCGPCGATFSSQLQTACPGNNVTADTGCIHGLDCQVSFEQSAGCGQSGGCLQWQTTCTQYDQNGDCLTTRTDCTQVNNTVQGVCNPYTFTETCNTCSGNKAGTNNSGCPAGQSKPFCSCVNGTPTVQTGSCGANNCAACGGGGGGNGGSCTIGADCQSGSCIYGTCQPTSAQKYCDYVNGGWQCDANEASGTTCNSATDCHGPPPPTSYCTQTGQCSTSGDPSLGTCTNPSQCLQPACSGTGISATCVLGGNYGSCVHGSDCQTQTPPPQSYCVGQTCSSQATSGVPCNSNTDCQNQQPTYCTASGQCSTSGDSALGTCTTTADCLQPACNGTTCALGGSGASCAASGDSCVVRTCPWGQHEDYVNCSCECVDGDLGYDNCSPLGSTQGLQQDGSCGCTPGATQSCGNCGLQTCYAVGDSNDYGIYLGDWGSCTNDIDPSCAPTCTTDGSERCQIGGGGPTCNPSNAGQNGVDAVDCAYTCNSALQCVQGGDGVKTCSPSHNTDFYGSDVQDRYDLTDCGFSCNSLNQCVQGGGSTSCNPSNNGSDCQPACNAQGQCAQGGTGVSCSTSADCSFCDNNDQCVPGDGTGGGAACSGDEDCTGVGFVGLSASESDCTGVAGQSSMFFSWNYTPDWNWIYGQAAHFVVEVSSTSDFSNPEYTQSVSASPFSSSASISAPVQNNQASPGCNADIQNCFLNFATPYYWRVELTADSNGSVAIPWVYYNHLGGTLVASNKSTVSTANAPYPFPSFTTGSAILQAGQTATFNATGSICYDGSGNQEPCTTSGITHTWSFLDGSTTTLEAYPLASHAFTHVSNNSSTRLQICETGGLCCQSTQLIKVTPDVPLPNYKEVSPF